MFGANVLGVINMCQTFLPELLVANGTIVNVGSVAGHMPLPFMSSYCATKAALHAYSECLRVEVAPLGVKVTYVQTGNVRTNKDCTKYHLDKRSLWYPIKDTYEREQERATGGMDSADFARRFATRMLGGYKHTIWIGEGSLMCRIIGALELYLPFRIFPFAFSQSYGMQRIASSSKMNTWLT